MRKILFLFIGWMVLLGCQTPAEMEFSGARASRYGIRPFPDLEEWGEHLRFIRKETRSEESAVIWIVGVISRVRGESCCRLNFPSDGADYDRILFSSIDENLEYLDYFEQEGVRVFLQVEPGDASVDDLISLVMNQYGSHPAVAGFGVDVEWFQVEGTDGWGTPPTDEEARRWEEAVRSRQADYRMFLKHWDPQWMPPSYRGDLIFVNDSQGFASLGAMQTEFTDWARFFYPNTVFFQTGYEADKELWSKLDEPVCDLSRILGEKVEQEYGFFWVDFTLRQMN